MTGRPPGGALLQAQGLTKLFPVESGLFARSKSRVHAVDDVTMEIRRGETLGLVGESGCGKTTTARLLVRLLEPTSGKILFSGADGNRNRSRVN